jgi:hypothetical protein
MAKEIQFRLVISIVSVHTHPKILELHMMHHRLITNGQQCLRILNTSVERPDR